MLAFSHDEMIVHSGNEQPKIGMAEDIHQSTCVPA